MSSKDWDIYCDEFIEAVSKETNINNDIVKELSNEFKNNIQPEISIHYLSHLISSIESIINKEKKDYFLKFIKKLYSEQKLDDNKYLNLLKIVADARIKYYPILLRSANNMGVSSKIMFKIDQNKEEYVAIIFYDDSITDIAQIRKFIAHELGHIYFKHITKIDKKKIEKETFSTLFAIFAIADKDVFYNKICKTFSNENILTSIKETYSLLTK